MRAGGRASRIALVDVLAIAGNRSPELPLSLAALPLDLREKQPCSRRASAWTSTSTKPLTYQEMSVSRGAGRSTGTGRFLSVDPYLDVNKALREPQRWNRYAYVVNNPLRYTDPDGREHVQEPGFTQSLAAADWSDAPPVIRGAFYVEGVLASEAAGEFIGAAFRGVQTVTRYMSDGEADAARRTGNIPNTDAQGNPRPTHVTTDKPLNSSTAAQKKYELPTTPTQRATVPKDRVPGGLGRTPDGRATTSGGGSQSATNQPIPVRPSEIKPLNQNLWDRVVGWFR